MHPDSNIQLQAPQCQIDAVTMKGIRIKKNKNDDGARRPDLRGKVER